MSFNQIKAGFCVLFFLVGVAVIHQHETGISDCVVTGELIGNCYRTNGRTTLEIYTTVDGFRSAFINCGYVRDCDEPCKYNLAKEIVWKCLKRNYDNNHEIYELTTPRSSFQEQTSSTKCAVVLCWGFMLTMV